MAIYEPDYAKGEIIVSYLEDIDSNDQFAKTFGKSLGYDLAGAYKNDDSVFIYKTHAGKEEEACEEFESQDKFTDWASRRDLKLERRWESLEQGIEMLTDLNDYAELPDIEYAERLDKIIAYLKTLQ